MLGDPVEARAEFLILFAFYLFIITIFNAKSFTSTYIVADPGDWSEDNWILVYANSQPDQLDNPDYAVYGSDWEAVKNAYPLIAKRALRVKRSLAKHKYKMEKGKWTRWQPFTRICVPSELGLANGLLPDDFVIRMNPTGPATDISSTLFYKAFIRYGRVYSGYAGKSQH